MKAGFSLIEVLISSTLATLLSLVLFLTWGQIQKTVIRADNTVSVSDRILLLQRQFEQDFMGICLPISRPYTKPTEKEESTVTTAAGNEKKEPADQKKEKPKIVERVFYATTQTGDNLDLLTFLTNNPMQVYWSNRAGGARPRIARVQYTLKKDESKKENKISYTLYRQEAYTLDFDQFDKESQKEGKKEVRSYALITGIKELKLTYWQEVQTKKEEKEGDKSKPKIVKDIKKVAVWDLEKEKPVKDTFIRPIPTMIKIELNLWDMQKKKAYAYTSMIPVPIYVPNPQEEQKKKEPQVQSVLSQLPIPERFRKQDGTAQPVQPPVPGAPMVPTMSPTDTTQLPKQLETEVTIIADDKGSLLKKLLNGKDINAPEQ